MKVIYNNIIPFKGFQAVNLFGYVFVRKGCEMEPTDLNHEAIHTAQMRELGYVFFYLIYFVEWLVRLCMDYKTAYRSISFEKEAYDHQDDRTYLSDRMGFAQWRKGKATDNGTDD